MIVVGVDPHKKTHTAVAVNAQLGELKGELTVAARANGHTKLIEWTRALDKERVFALEDCRHVSGALERFLIDRGERVVRVPPKLMGEARRGARSFGKSDSIDALAVARAVLREPDLPQARLAGAAREIALLLDHREDLVGERNASSGKRQRHRLNRKGNRQLNCALHRIAVAQGRMHAPARAFLARKQAEGKSRREALRCLKRNLARVVFKMLHAIAAAHRDGERLSVHKEGEQCFQQRSAAALVTAT